MEAYHRIAGLVLGTCSSIDLPFLRRPSFRKFEVEPQASSINFFIHDLSGEPCDRAAPTGETAERILARSGGRPDRLESPLLRFRKVVESLERCMSGYEFRDIQIHKNWVIISDFDSCRFDLFQYIDDDPLLGKHPPFVHIEDSFQRMVATFLPVFSALLVHAGAVVRSPGAAVFLGTGDAGKTTVTTRLTRSPLLSDDLIIMKEDEGRVDACATPLSENTSGDHRARVGGVFMLGQADRFRLTRLSPADLVQCLMRTYKHYTPAYPAFLKKSIFDVCYRVSRQAPFYLMEFARDHVDWDAVDAAMEG